MAETSTTTTGTTTTGKRRWPRAVARELLLLARNPLYWFCIVVAPLICVVFFTTILDSGMPTDMPIGMVDMDNTSTSRSLTRNLDAFQHAHITAHYANVTDARRALQRGDIYGFFYVPEGFTREANAYRMPTLSFYTNNSYYLPGSLLSTSMRTMSELASGSATQKTLLAKGATTAQAMAFIQPIVTDTHPTNNPWLNYNIYLSNIIVPGILGIFLLMVTVYGIGSEIKEGTAHDWIVINGGNIYRALLTKLLPQTFFFMLTGVAIDLWLYGYMAFPANSGIGDAILLMFLFIIASQGLGVFMITLMPTLRMALSSASLWGVVSFSISGMTYPVMAMDWPLQSLAALFPLRHYFLIYVNSMLDGYELSNAMPYVAALLGFAVIPLFVAPWLKKELMTVKYVP